MSPLLVVGAIELANNIGGQIIGSYRDRKAREWQEEMWNKQNEYNLPINQRQRLEEAGINPNLAFGSSASATGTNVPGSPHVTSPQLNLGEFYLRKKQAEAEIRSQDARTRREDEVTEQLRMNNTIMETLLNDTIATKRGDMYVQRILQGWKEDNLRNELDIGLATDQQKLDVLKADELLKIAQINYSQQALENLIQEYHHLQTKYGYEDEYYFNRMNPYETSTPLGIMRYIMGNIQNFLESLGVKL